MCKKQLIIDSVLSLPLHQPSLLISSHGEASGVAHGQEDKGYFFLTPLHVTELFPASFTEVEDRIILN